MNKEDFWVQLRNAKQSGMWLAKMNQRHCVFGNCAEINDLNDPMAQAQHIMININISYNPAIDKADFTNIIKIEFDDRDDVFDGTKIIHVPFHLPCHHLAPSCRAVLEKPCKCSTTFTPSLFTSLLTTPFPLVLLLFPRLFRKSIFLI